MGRRGRSIVTALVWALATGCGGTVHDDRAGSHAGDPTGHGGSAARDAGTVLGTGGAGTDADAGTSACAQDNPRVAAVGNGLCPAPPPPTPHGSLCACWPDVFPNADQCMPSHALDFGGRPCCGGGTCGFDFGKGCATTDQLENPQGSSLERCDQHSGGPAVVMEGSVQLVALSDHFVWTARPNDNNSVLTAIDKASCAPTDKVTISTVTALTGVPWGVLYADTSGKLTELDEDGTQTDALARVGVAYTGALSVGTDGRRVYALLSLESGSALVELPHDGGAPQVVASLEDLTATKTRLVVDGSSVYALSVSQVLDRNPRSTLRQIDVSTGTVEIALDSAQAFYPAFAASDGAVYLGESRAVSSMRLPGCFTYTILDYRPGQIDAFTLATDTFFWAESSAGLRFSTVYSLPRSGGDVTNLGDVNGSVRTVMADATDVYVFVQDKDTPNERVVRLSRK